MIHTRDCTLDLEELGMSDMSDDLVDLGNIFTKEEVWGVIRELPSNHAPGPDRFIGAFYQRASPIIKPELMEAICNSRGFGSLNRALISLIPKKNEAPEVGDYRQNSFVHTFSKVWTKLLAHMLRPKMELPVSRNHSAFNKGRHQHENFTIIRQMARKINC
jgi:hypothetical protein